MSAPVGPPGPPTPLSICNPIYLRSLAQGTPALLPPASLRWAASPFGEHLFLFTTAHPASASQLRRSRLGPGLCHFQDPSLAPLGSPHSLWGYPHPLAARMWSGRLIHCQES